MPFKANASRRHHIPRQRHRVRNWAEYDAGLRARGSLTVWFTREAVERWRAETRTTPGGQRLYSDLAITTALTLRALFRLPLRQTEGLVGSIIHLLGVELAVPDHSTVSRRAKVVRLPVMPASSSGAVDLLVDSTGVKLCGPGEWLVEKHGTKRRRAWKKLHVGLDAVTGRIVAATLTDHDVDDGSQVGPLLDQKAVRNRVRPGPLLSSRLPQRSQHRCRARKLAAWAVTTPAWMPDSIALASSNDRPITSSRSSPLSKCRISPSLITLLSSDTIRSWI